MLPTTSPGTTGRYVVGQIDPADRADEYGNTLIAYGLTAIAQANNIGTTLIAEGATLVAMGASLTAFSISQLAFGNTFVSLDLQNSANIIGYGNTMVCLGQYDFGIRTFWSYFWINRNNIFQHWLYWH